MFGRMQVVALLTLAAYLGGMFAIWKLWLPIGDLQIVAWWAMEGVLAFLSFQALLAAIMARGVQKSFDDFDKRFKNF